MSTAVTDRPPLTERQAAIFRMIVAHIGEHQRPPSIRDVMAAFDIRSPNGVVSNLRAIAEKGWLVLDAKHARGIRVPDLEARYAAVTGEYLAGLGDTQTTEES